MSVWILKNCLHHLSKDGEATIAPDELPQRMKGQCLTQTKIHLIVGLQSTTLMVFYTEAHCWQFRVINYSSAMFGERKLYYTPRQLKEENGNGLLKEVEQQLTALT